MAALALATACSTPASSNSASTTLYPNARGGKHLTALDRYVSKPDPAYQWKEIASYPFPGGKTFILDMTSQTFLTTNEVNRTEWKHWLMIAVPDKVDHDKALLFIEGGSNGGNPPKGSDEKLVQIALQSHSIVAQLKMVPNEPLVFAGETERRTEDGIIAYTWDKFLRTGDEKWPLRLPMTKSAVRAMDTVTAFCAQPSAGAHPVTAFAVSGGSKRGWTTWTTAAVDRRVIAIVPFVIDVLNMVPSMQHHYASYGFWAPAVGDYEHQGIMDWVGTKEMEALLDIEGPYSYRDRYTMPKFIVNSAGDQFFLPDSSHYYFDQLPGTKYLRYVPNSDHSLKNTDAIYSLFACYNAVLRGDPLPIFSWTSNPDGTLRVTTKTKPTEVKLWTATNPKARDFRLESFGPGYHSTPLVDEGGGVFTAHVPKPEAGWTAYFIELTFPGSATAPFKFTTDVHVIPDTTPHRFQPKLRR